MKVQLLFRLFFILNGEGKMREQERRADTFYVMAKCRYHAGNLL